MEDWNTYIDWEDWNKESFNIKIKKDYFSLWNLCDGDRRPEANTSPDGQTDLGVAEDQNLQESSKTLIRLTFNEKSSISYQRSSFIRKMCLMSHQKRYEEVWERKPSNVGLKMTNYIVKSEWKLETSLVLTIFAFETPFPKISYNSQLKFCSLFHMKSYDVIIK